MGDPPVCHYCGEGPASYVDGLFVCAGHRDLPSLGDDPHPSDNDRYAIYRVTSGRRKRVAETSLDGIGVTLETLRGDGEYSNDDKIGILDRRTRAWLVCPWARG